MTSSMTTQPDAWKVIVGVDTHKHVHVAVAIDTRGIRLGDQSFVADSGGYRALIAWADTHERIEAVPDAREIPVQNSVSLPFRRLSGGTAEG